MEEFSKERQKQKNQNQRRILLFVQLCHPGTKWFGITHWISPAMFLCKSHMINHCLIHNEMQTFAARRHNAELFLHFLFVSLYYTAKLFIIFIFTTSNASKACRKGQKLCKLSINLEAAVWIFWKFWKIFMKTHVVGSCFDTITKWRRLTY